MSERTEREQLSRLLIVEDDAGQLRTLSDIMRKEGFDVVGASTASQALECVRREDFGIAVVDLRLPDLTGTQLLEKIHRLNHRVRVIINTGYGSFDSAKEAVNLGAFAYVEKAGDPDELVRHVHAAFRRHVDRYAQDLEEAVAERTSELRKANEALRREITERKQAEEGSRRHQEDLQIIFDSVPATIWYKDRKNRILRVNKAAAEWLDMSREDIEGKTTYELFPEHAKKYYEDDLDVMNSGQPRLGIIEPLLLPTGEQRWVRTDKIPYRDEGGNIAGVIAFVLDITEGKRAEDEKEGLEAQLRQAQKMEAVGRLAGGVAHDFNNILTAILGNVELMQSSMRRRLADDDPWLAEAAQIEQSALRAADLTRHLLALGRQQVLRPEILNPNRILAGMEKMLRRLIREDIELAVCPAADLRSIRADAGQIEQVIMNLTLNARDAMPHGGKLTLATANVSLDEEYVAQHAEGRVGPHVMLSVSDTGCGMDEGTLERVFDPFFTTKPVGEGTGLGLATVHGIVQQSGGHVIAASEPGQGTTFRVYLPSVSEPAGIAVAQRPEEEEEAGGQETILLCEDESLVRQLTCEALQGRGYTVIAAEHGKRALELAEAHPGPVHLLVTDVIMPNMNGRQLAEALTESQRAMKVLYISGYTSSVIGGRGIADEAVEFLQKPFLLDDLFRRVREVLDRSGNESRGS